MVGDAATFFSAFVDHLDFDMIGSPNFVRYVYDGDSSDALATIAVNEESATVERVSLTGLDQMADAMAHSAAVYAFTPLCERLPAPPEGLRRQRRPRWRRCDDILLGNAGDDALDGGEGDDFLADGQDTDVCVNGETVRPCESDTGFPAPAAQALADVVARTGGGGFMESPDDHHGASA